MCRLCRAGSSGSVIILNATLGSPKNKKQGLTPVGGTAQRCPLKNKKQGLTPVRGHRASGAP